jgi:hypothetical protein
LRQEVVVGVRWNCCIPLAEESDKEKPPADDKPETTTPTSSAKRPREEKVDPTKAPDPEEPEENFDSEKFQSDADQGFKPPDDDSTITLDSCEWEASCVTGIRVRGVW